MSITGQNFSDLTIIIPTLNEEKTISILLSKIEETLPKASVIVSDDGSIDKTKENVETFTGNIETIFLDRSEEKIHGLTVSVIDAIRMCSTSCFLVMDGDLQHPVSSLPEFYVKLKSNSDIVAGNRIEVIGKWPFHRKMMSYIAKCLGNLSLFLRRRNRIKDTMTGLFGSKTDLWIETIDSYQDKFVQEGYKILFDFLKIYPNKLAIDNVDYIFGTRDYGESKINKKIIWRFFKSLF